MLGQFCILRTRIVTANFDGTSSFGVTQSVWPPACISPQKCTSLTFQILVAQNVAKLPNIQVSGNRVNQDLAFLAQFLTIFVNRRGVD
jgi:hypothetical protein